MLDMSWKHTDPRESINKRGVIVIWATEGEVIRAGVSTKESWCIFLHGRGPDKKDFISENEEWPTGWKWTWAPRD